jgi:hypothetical protein
MTALADYLRHQRAELAERIRTARRRGEFCEKFTRRKNEMTPNREMPGKILERAARNYARHLRRSVSDKALPVGTIKALRETIEMLANFGRASQHVRRKFVVDEFETRLKLVLGDEINLHHVRKEIDRAIPVLH